VQFHGVIGAKDGGLSAIEFGHRGQGIIGLPLIDQPGRFVNQTPERFNADRHFGQLHLSHLIGPQRRAENGSFFHIFNAGFQAGFRESQRLTGDHDPGDIEKVHELSKTVPFFSHQIGLGHADILERDLRGVAGANAHFSVKLISRHALRVRRNNNQAEAVMLFFFGIGNALGHHKITNGAVGDEHFTAVNHIVFAVFDCPGFVTGNIGSGIRFGIGSGADLRALANRRQIRFFLFFRTVVQNGFAAETRSNNVQTDAHIHFGDLFRDDGIAQDAGAGTAVFFRNPRAHQTIFGRLDSDFRQVFFMFIALCGYRPDFRHSKLIGHLLQHLHLFRQFIIHACSPFDPSSRLP